MVFVSEASSGSDAKYTVGAVLIFGILSAILILQEHYIAGGAAALAAVIYAGRARVKRTGNRES